MTENTQNHGVTWSRWRSFFFFSLLGVLRSPQPHRLLFKVALAMCFIACGTGFYGLTFSAGQLHPNIYLHLGAVGIQHIISKWKYVKREPLRSLGLLCAIDIPGYSVVLLVDCVGKRRLQLRGRT